MTVHLYVWLPNFFACLSVSLFDIYFAAMDILSLLQTGQLFQRTTTPRYREPDLFWLIHDKLQFLVRIKKLPHNIFLLCFKLYTYIISSCLKGNLTEKKYSYVYVLFFCLDSTISQLENGILVLSAIKEGGSCSAKLACSLGAATRTSFKNKDGIISLVDAFLPDRYAGFTSAFNRAARAEEGADHQTCTGSCHRCIQF